MSHTTGIAQGNASDITRVRRRGTTLVEIEFETGSSSESGNVAFITDLTEPVFDQRTICA